MSLNGASREINVTNTGITTFGGAVNTTATNFGYGLIKTGLGRLDLTSTSNAYDGETDVVEGELRITGNIAGSALTLVKGGTLSGTGTVGALTLQTGVLAPGAGTVGTLNSGNLLFSGGTFALEISSASLADEVKVTGTAALGANTELSISLVSGYVAQAGNSWVIVDNDGVDPFSPASYSFTSGGNPILNNAPFTSGGNTYVLNYNGGTGNDVVLTVVPEPATSAFALMALPLLGLRRRRRSSDPRKQERVIQ